MGGNFIQMRLIRFSRKNYVSYLIEGSREKTKCELEYKSYNIGLDYDGKILLSKVYATDEKSSLPKSEVRQQSPH